MFAFFVLSKWKSVFCVRILIVLPYLPNVQVFVYLLIVCSLEKNFAKSDCIMKIFCIFVPCNKLNNRQLR